MFDFVEINCMPLDSKNEKFEVSPKFIIKRSKDLMIKGRSFYAVWDEENQLWCTDEYYISKVIDVEVQKQVIECKRKHPDAEKITGKYLSNFSSNKWTEWQKYVKSLPDNFHELDTKITFANSKVHKSDYISKRLPYELTNGSCDAYDEMMSVLYSDEERRKLEWAVGSIIAGDSIHIQKFLVLYGPPKSGKSTFLHILEKLFEGYYTTFEAKALGSVNNPFALEAFKNNPLIAIQHDGDLSRIEDNTKINQIVAHEDIVVNEKFKSTYATHFNSMLFLGTNKPVRITDAKSGIIRRLIDVEPTGNTIPRNRYDILKKQIIFELGSIANKCLTVYKELGESYYDGYKSLKMMGATNDLFNFMDDVRLDIINKYHNEITLNTLWAMYNKYCDESNIPYKLKKTQFKEESKSYFKEFKERTKDDRNIYSGLISEKFIKNDEEEPDFMPYVLQFNKKNSLFDDWCKEKGFKAQYANKEEKPIAAWDDVKTTVADIDTHKLHYILVPPSEHHIFIDFDLKDEEGNKSFERNLEEASKWPATYAELSKSGGGIHLHYFYDGDVSKLQKDYAPGIEIKTNKNKSPIRRKLTKCNDVPIATINSGLPLKGEDNVVPTKELQNEKHLRNKIARCLTKKSAGSTSQCVSLIKQHLDDAYKSGISYDVSDMEDDIFKFAMNSTNNSERCMKMVDEMKFKSKDIEENESHSEVNGFGETDDEKPLVFFDIEVFPNVFMICWKYAGDDKKVTKLINPPPNMIKDLFDNNRMIGFNNRDYDNHICWYYMQGYTPYMCYDISNRIINKKDGSAKAWQAYGLSYTDVYDLASNPHKMSLKKWQIKLKMHHQENAYPWDEDLDKSKWDEVAEYCENDVISTEAVYNHIKGDVVARILLSKLSGLTPNDKTNKHSMQIIFGDDENPQSEFIYTDLSKMFPGYKFDPTAKANKSTYKGYSVGEGGFVWAKPGMYRHVVTFDVASMHPSSLIAMNMFGDRYTKRFKEIKDARLAVKHKDRESLKTLLGGQLLEFYDVAVKGEEYTLGDLATALKTVINSVYGLTAAKFENRCRDPRNIDNIVAKRGALFMVNLKEEVEKRGGMAVHFKTDSIKVVNPNKELEDFIISYGREYGYEFEVESVYDRFCLVNDAVYIAKEGDEWTATGAEFAHPYIFKKLFSKEDISIDDMSETKNAEKGALYLDFDESLPKDTHDYRFVGKVSAFIPVKDGCGGARLVVKRDEDKYDSAPGAKDYRWLETEYVKNNHREKDVDMNYYDNLIDSAIAHINEFGNFDRFVNDDSYDPQLDKLINVPEGVDEEIPFDPPFMNRSVA